MAPGAIIVKENYMPDGTLAAVTTMFKVRGYKPDVNDWFFTKHLPSGELDRAPTGMAMEGRLPVAPTATGADERLRVHQPARWGDLRFLQSCRNGDHRAGVLSRAGHQGLRRRERDDERHGR